MSASGEGAPGGRAVLARGTSADLLDAGGGRAVKLYHARGGEAALGTESRALARAAEAGIAVPTVYGRADEGERPGLLMAWRREPTVLRHIVSRPAAAPGTLRAMARLHRQVHSLDGAGLPAQKDAVRRTLAQAPLGTRLRRAVSETLEALPDGTALCHGDIHLGNVLVSESGLCILDWEKACRGAPAGDLARSLVLIRHGTFDGPLPRPVVAVARGWLARRYRLAYQGAGEPLDAGELDAWIAIMAAAKLAFVPEGQAAGMRRRLEHQLLS